MTPKKLNRRARRALAHAAAPPPPVESGLEPGALRRGHIVCAACSLLGVAAVWMEVSRGNEALAQLAAGAERLTFETSPGLIGVAGFLWAMHLLVLSHRPLRKLRGQGVIVLGLLLTAGLAGWIVGERRARSLRTQISAAGYALCDTRWSYRGPTRYEYARPDCALLGAPSPVG